MDKAKANAVAEFRVSQPFFDTYDVYCGNGFDDCLTQVGSIYPNLDLFQIAINGTVLPTLGGDNSISDELDDSAHTVE